MTPEFFENLRDRCSGASDQSILAYSSIDVLALLNDLDTAYGALADIASGNDMTQLTMRAKAGRVYGKLRS